MAGRFLDLLGTSFSKLALGIFGPQLKNESDEVALRDNADSAYAALRAALIKVYGDDILLNAGAAGSGADWKMTLSRPDTGMTHDVQVVMPSGDPAPGQALTVASFTSNVVVLEYTTIAGGADKVVVDTTTVGFGASSPIAAFTKPANAIVNEVEVIIDTPYDDPAATMSVGISGTTAKYMPTSAVDLSASAKTAFCYKANEAAVGSTEAIIVTLSPAASAAGSARVLVYYSIPS